MGGSSEKGAILQWFVSRSPSPKNKLAGWPDFARFFMFLSGLSFRIVSKWFVGVLDRFPVNSTCFNAAVCSLAPSELEIALIWSQTPYLQPNGYPLTDMEQVGCEVFMSPKIFSKSKFSKSVPTN